jgi:amino acid transporter
MYIVEQPYTKSFIIENQPVTKGLKKVLGLPALFIIAIGLVVSQTSIVSVLQGSGLGGGTFLIAILLAFVLTVCYISTYSELSLMLPKAGSISTYTAVSIGHFAAIIAALAAYIAPQSFLHQPNCYCSNISWTSIRRDLLPILHCCSFGYLPYLIFWVLIYLLPSRG